MHLYTYCNLRSIGTKALKGKWNGTNASKLSTVPPSVAGGYKSFGSSNSKRVFSGDLYLHSTRALRLKPTSSSVGPYQLAAISTDHSLTPMTSRRRKEKSASTAIPA